MLPMAIVMVALAPVAPRLVEHVGTKLVVGTGLLIVTGGLLVVATVPVTNGYPHLLIGFCLVSTGMALTMAPATESIMGSLPPSKAGVGSAMNDTTREVGGALGIAVFGSIVNSAYRANIDLSGLQLTPAQAAEAEDSIGGAAMTASNAGGSTGAGIIEQAAKAFTDAFNLASIIGAVIVVVSAALVARSFTRAKEANAAATSPVRPGEAELELVGAAGAPD
jgi:MFS family permease